MSAAGVAGFCLFAGGLSLRAAGGLMRVTAAAMVAAGLFLVVLMVNLLYRNDYKPGGGRLRFISFLALYSATGFLSMVAARLLFG